MNDDRFLTGLTCRRLTEKGWADCPISLAAECTLTVTVDGRALPPISCSPVEPEELITGRLITEGLIRSAEQLRSLRLDGSGLPERLCAEAETAPARTPPAPRVTALWNAEMLDALQDYVLRDAQKNRGSHSTHSCTLMCGGEILCCREDIGRHNAIDRAVGWAARSGVDISRCIVFFSGRVSAEAIRRAAAAGVTVFCAKALPTAQAVRLAAEQGVTLLLCSPSRGILKF